MSTTVTDIARGYLRELSNHRKWFAGCYFLVMAGTLVAALTWPKTYTSFSTIYADNSNILQPLMEGNAVTTSIVDQARNAREIIFKRTYYDDVLKAAGYPTESLTLEQKDSLIEDIQDQTVISNVGANPASLIRIAFSDSNPVKAFSVAQKYTSLFIEESVVEKRDESKSAFDFIQNQVTTYHTKLQLSEERLSTFKSKNNNGTLAETNSRISRYRSDIERLELELVQLGTEGNAVERELSGESEIAKDISDMVNLRNRINSLQMQLDTLKSRFHDNYPDVIQLQAQIDDLMGMYETGDAGLLIQVDDLAGNGITPLHQQLRSRLAAIKTSMQTKNSQLAGVKTLLAEEVKKISLINESEAQLAELTRDYNVTRDFYNDMLKKLENARVSMHLDEEQQGVTFKVQEQAVIPTQPDGLSFSKLLIGSFLAAVAAPLGLLVLYMELDPRIRSESNFVSEWPPLLMVVPPLKSGVRKAISDRVLIVLLVVVSLFIYGAAFVVNILDLF
jgi:polysaccharide chain length determinant protein (PEP-CTERM system associated)